MLLIILTCSEERKVDLWEYEGTGVIVPQTGQRLITQLLGIHDACISWGHRSGVCMAAFLGLPWWIASFLRALLLGQDSVR